MPSSRVEVQCPHCSKSYRVGSDKLGRNTVCQECRQQFTLAAVSEELADPVDLSAALPPEPPVDIPQVAKVDHPPKKPSTKSYALMAAGAEANSSERATFLQMVGAGIFVAFIVGLGFYTHSWKSDARKSVGEAIDKAFIAPKDPPTVERVNPPSPPPPAPAPLPAVKPLAFKTTGTVSVADGRAARRGKSTSVRIYLPPGATAASRVPCVFVAPAGSNLLTGVEFGPDERGVRAGRAGGFSSAAGAGRGRLLLHA